MASASNMARRNIAGANDSIKLTELLPATAYWKVMRLLRSQNDTNQLIKKPRVFFLVRISRGLSPIIWPLEVVNLFTPTSPIGLVVLIARRTTQPRTRKKRWKKPPNGKDQKRIAMHYSIDSVAPAIVSLKRRLCYLTVCRFFSMHFQFGSKMKNAFRALRAHLISSFMCAV